MSYLFSFYYIKHRIMHTFIIIRHTQTLRLLCTQIHNYASTPKENLFLENELEITLDIVRRCTMFWFNNHH